MATAEPPDTPSFPSPVARELGPPSADDFAPGTPAHTWFEDAAELDDEAEPDDEAERPWPNLAGERSILLRERAPEQPPAPSGSSRDPIAPQLVILTSLGLVRTPGASTARLELAGAGAVAVDVLPIDDYHLRLSVVGAGAVPSFLAARPAVNGLEVVAVERHEHIIDVELEHGPGWVIAGIEQTDNGAAVALVQVGSQIGAGQP